MKLRSSLIALCVLALWVMTAQATPITRYTRFTGQYNHVATGGSLRASASDGCALVGSSTSSLLTIPAGANVVAAYLYWGGSGASADTSVTFNGNTITASGANVFDEVLADGREFFGGVADVTSLVSGNGSYTFSGLTVDNGGAHCSISTVVAGWSLVVIYGSTTEPLRAINVFHGLQNFLASSISLVPDGFRIPATGIDGRFTAITWEGDPGNSGSSGGFSEALRFNGSTKDDGIVPAGSDPVVQQFDGTISNFGLGIDTSYGVDIDTYDVSSQLQPGQTSATTVYSAGLDRVLLTAQIVSVTSEPLVDLSITKAHTGNFTVGTNASYSLQVANGTGTGIISVDYPITVTDTLAAGLSFVSGVGTGWSCSAVGQVVTCMNPNPGFLLPGQSLPALALTVAVGNGVFPSGNTVQNVSVANTATVGAVGTFEIDNSNNSSTDTATVLGSNLSTSSKAVTDLNGVEADPGETLRYTITITNSAAVATTGAGLTDSFPANISSFNVVGVPAGASYTTTGAGTGANGTGALSVSGINVPAGDSVSIEFDVVIATGTSPGATLDNTADVVNPAGIGATVTAPQVVVSPSQVPGAGTKQLYLWNSPRALSRQRPTGTPAMQGINGNNQLLTWVLTPQLQRNLSLAAGNYNVTLLLARTGASGGGANNRTITVSLSNSVLGVLGSATRTITNLLVTATAQVFTLNMAAVTAPAGSTFTLTINNNSNNSFNRSVAVTDYNATTYSRVDLNALTVINVDSVQTFNASLPGGVLTSSFARGSTVFVRAVVSDPFGDADITGANLTLLDPGGATVAANEPMTNFADADGGTRTYLYAHALSGTAPAGVWTVRVTAREGVEGTITDQGIGGFTVTTPLPVISLEKQSTVISDPASGTVNPKRVPGAVVRYAITVRNSGPGSVDPGTLQLTDVVPADTELCVALICASPTVEFVDGTPVSGLSFSPATHVSYSSNVGGGAPFSHVPSPDPNGFDGSITGLRVAPAGTFAAASVSGFPSFVIRFTVRIR
jgi:trimeric autotransporter adhesin